VHRRLRNAQGKPSPRPRDDPLRGLISTVLSQHTSDVNSARAMTGLERRFGSWQEVVEAPVEEVAAAIRAGGIANVKAQRIQEILREVERREGGLDLSRLQALPDAKVDHYLRSLPGVGPKTAACVLLFSMGRPAFPIDTHVQRVATRLGLLPPGLSGERAHALLAPRVPAELRYDFHVELIRHGREVCRPALPRCTACAVFDLCEAGPRLLAQGAAR
jgi:endonuclease III